MAGARRHTIKQDQRGLAGQQEETLTRSNRQPRNEAGAGRGQEAAPTATEPAKEAPVTAATASPRRHPVRLCPEPAR
jgi:hypothetical protein